ncbi:MAG TPA: pyridoxal phosphate-dependent aminotransferase [Vicinamibacteria bacterium]|nr:pyridoxal phosphate-dependent aminotransferase [Vicinamibacteria bacterium]
MAPSISSRGRLMPASPIRRLMPAADAAKRRGVHVYHLNIGQPDIETPAAFRDRLGRIREKVLAYSPSAGTPEYLEALRHYYRGIGIEVGQAELIGTTGGSEAVLFAFAACADDGDDVLVVEPFYTNYASFARLAGLRLVPLTARGEDGFHLPSREAWEASLTPRTRAVILCNPNNPTGTVYTREELERVAEFCRDRNLFLISDEVYREFVYDGREAVSALSLEGLEDRVVVVDSLSKRYSACGIRLGALLTRNREFHDACLRMAQGRLSPPGIAQAIAVGLTEISPEYTRTVVAEYQERRDILFEGLSRIPGLFLRKPEGAFYFVARLPIDDADEFARFLLEDFSDEGATVMVAPAPGFYATPGLGRSEVRIAYVLNADDLRRSVEVLARAVEAYRGARDREGVPAAVPGAS